MKSKERGEGMIMSMIILLLFYFIHGLTCEFHAGEPVVGESVIR